jgi:GTP-binding protein
MSMNINSAVFVKGVIGDDYMQGDSKPQIAFLGRSNVGKSSVINSLLERKNLARSSATPGKTTEANFYLINDEFYLVDFPGFGFAKMSKKERDKIAKRILWYLQYSPVRPHLVVLVIDAQVGLTDMDKEMLHILKSHGHRTLVIANKADKLNQSERAKKSNELHKELHDVDMLMYSARTKRGRHVAVEAIFNTRI